MGMNKTCIDSIEKLQTELENLRESQKTFSQSLQQENAKLKEDLKQQNKSLVRLQADTSRIRLQIWRSRKSWPSQAEKKTDSNDLTYKSDPL